MSQGGQITGDDNALALLRQGDAAGVFKKKKPKKLQIVVDVPAEKESRKEKKKVLKAVDAPTPIGFSPLERSALVM